jgi:hypothetical protein
MKGLQTVPRTGRSVRRLELIGRDFEIDMQQPASHRRKHAEILDDHNAPQVHRESPWGRPFGLVLRPRALDAPIA